MELTKKKPEKSLLRPLKKTGGRNKQGRITVRHRGGGAKRRYRIIGFPKEKIGEKAKVVALEYDPNRTANIALLEYSDQTKAYIIAPEGLKVGDEVEIAEKTEVKLGNRMLLKNIPRGTFVYDIEFVPGKGKGAVRSAGATAKVMAHEGKYTIVKMPSKEIRKFLSQGFASIGQVSNIHHRFENLGKAGRMRWKGRRPTVRGTAMTPVDHPHGGGEGRTGVGRKHPKTPWGKLAHGGKTRKKKQSDKLIIKRRNE